MFSLAICRVMQNEIPFLLVSKRINLHITHLALLQNKCLMFNKETVAVILNTLKLGISPIGLSETCSQVNVLRKAANICNNKLKHHLFTVCHLLIKALHRFLIYNVKLARSVLRCKLEAVANVNRSWRHYYVLYKRSRWVSFSEKSE